MRKSIAILALIVSCGGTALAHDENSVRSIAVSGTVETKTAPDQVVWSISLTDTDKDMRNAKLRNDKRVKSVIALRDKLGIGEGDFETGQVSIRREHERTARGGRGAFKHFVVDRSVIIRQRDLKRFDEFLDALVASTEMEVSFTFSTSRIHEIRAETRLKALQVAKEKATAMAEVVGAKLGRVLTISEGSSGRGWTGANLANNAVFDAGGPAVADLATEKFVPGAISVTMTVHATFALE